ncbi:HGxxPAAW family protein [Streptosporangium amethystogenes]|uniref:HGxxPAAW family protein n=1 Tax=Streptosporangium amethystogenes TaxID=2002 RepID=UPI00056D3210|nr:HGxxPAAW family protein [Streptosporangium amethystogenes]
MTARDNHWGRASSWLAVTVIMLGFGIAGTGLCMGPDWFLLWAGTTVCAIGAILVLVFRVFQDVVLDGRRTTRDRTARGVLG